MNDNNGCFIQVPIHYNPDICLQGDQGPLFGLKSEQLCTDSDLQEYEKLEIIQKIEAIDEQLLAKMSQLHETLRNKKLLQFQLIEAKIMSKHRLKECHIMQDDIQKLKIAKLEIEIENESSETDTLALKKQIDAQKAKNADYLKTVQELNYKTMRVKQKIEEISSNKTLKQNKNGQNRFISVEKIRLQAENSSKHEIVSQIKLAIAQIRSKIAQKQSQFRKLQEQEQTLMKEIKNQDKIQSKMQKQGLMSHSKPYQQKVYHNLSICQNKQKNSFSFVIQNGIKKQPLKNNDSVMSVQKVSEKGNQYLGSVAKSTKTQKKANRLAQIKSIR